MHLVMDSGVCIIRREEMNSQAQNRAKKISQEDNISDRHVYILEPIPEFFWL
jgi:hypothetical protein